MRQLGTTGVVQTPGCSRASIFYAYFKQLGPLEHTRSNPLRKQGAMSSINEP